MVTKFVNDDHSEEQAKNNLESFLKHFNYNEEIDIIKNVQEQNIGIAKLNNVSYQSLNVDLHYEGWNLKALLGYDRVDIFLDDNSIIESKFRNEVNDFQSKIKDIMDKLSKAMLFERLACEVAFESQNEIAKAIDSKYEKIDDVLQVFIHIQNIEGTINKSYSIRQETQTKKMFDIIEFNSKQTNDYSSNKANVELFINDFRLAEMISYYDKYR